MSIKRSVVVGLLVATVALGAGGIGLASAATDSANGGASLADKIASKFNLNKADVQAVFDQDRADRHAQMEANMKDRLAQAVKDGKLTQAQSDHITSTLAEVDNLRGNTPPDQLSDSVRQQIRSKLSDLRQWAKDNNIDMHLLGPGGHHFGGPGHPGMDSPADSNS
jgi:hypothetical protein